MQKHKFVIDLYGQIITHTVTCESQAEAWVLAVQRLKELTEGAKILVKSITMTSI